MGARITRPGRLLCAIEGLSVDFTLIGLEVDFERSPLARLKRDLAEPAELVFGVMPAIVMTDLYHSYGWAPARLADPSLMVAVTGKPSTTQPMRSLLYP